MIVLILLKRKGIINTFCAFTFLHAGRHHGTGCVTVGDDGDFDLGPFGRFRRDRRTWRLPPLQMEPLFVLVQTFHLFAGHGHCGTQRTGPEEGQRDAHTHTPEIQPWVGFYYYSDKKT